MGRNPSVNLSTPKKIRSDATAIRRSFRVPVELEDGILVVLNGTPYPASDISPGGINILCRDKSAFTLAQVIENCKLILQGDTIENLTARIIHLSCGSDGSWTNGIQWVNLSDNALDKIVQQVSKIKNRLRQPTLDI